MTVLHRVGVYFRYRDFSDWTFDASGVSPCSALRVGPGHGGFSVGSFGEVPGCLETAPVSAASAFASGSRHEVDSLLSW